MCISLCVRVCVRVCFTHLVGQHFAFLREANSTLRQKAAGRKKCLPIENPRTSTRRRVVPFSSRACDRSYTSFRDCKSFRQIAIVRRCPSAPWSLCARTRDEASRNWQAIFCSRRRRWKGRCRRPADERDDFVALDGSPTIGCTMQTFPF